MADHYANQDTAKDPSLINGKYKPFEVQTGLVEEVKNQKQAVYNLNNFKMKACDLTDLKTKAIYEELMPQEGHNAKGRRQKKKVINVFDEEPEQSQEEQKRSNLAQNFQQSAFSMRLQTENPFEEFRQAVERAVIQKYNEPKREFKPDQKFFREQDDIGLCLSMHQPWASLVVQGIKRFEGREWTNKYRGPLWIHSTAKKPA
mmetsp:Transcript_7603/g.12780  ORF Transcript_7603/g.12780 Transcript_7603/m.12780 type:complete len:202 (-) Transcript_7603:1266-1871(-)